MKKKLLSKLFLLFAILGGANSVWASTEADLASITAATTFTMDGLNGTSGLVDKTLYADSKLLCLGGCGYSTSKGSTKYNEVEYKNVYQIKSNRQIALKIGFNATITIVGQSHAERKWRLGTSSAENDLAESAVSTTTLTAVVDGSSTAKVVYINASGDLYIGAIIITGNAEPTISATPASISLTAIESGTAVNGSFTITGSNLTNGTYNLTVPSVTGLTVSPTSFTVSEGNVNQVINVSYSSTENVPASSAVITATVDGKNLSVPVNYSANVVSWTLQSISTSKTWDFDTKVTSSLGSTELKFEGDNATTEHVYANISELSFIDPFDATALAFTGVFPFRSSSKRFAQEGTLRFNTTVPGKIVVKFSDTGSKASSSAVKRYLVVNGEKTEYWTSRENNGTENPYSAQLNVTTGAISVPAGNVTISGSSAIIISYVEFTAMPTSVSGTITASGYNTYSSNYPLDLSTISGGMAYVASSVTDGKVVLTKCTDKVPAGTGLFIAGTAEADFTIGTTAEATTAPAVNHLVGAPNGKTVNKAADGEFNYVFGWTEVTNPGFYLVNGTSAELPAFKAYLHTTTALTGGSGARLALSFGDESTGINTVNVNENDNRFYDLMGRRVAQPQQGLYIVNGKKVIIK